MLFLVDFGQNAPDCRYSNDHKLVTIGSKFVSLERKLHKLSKSAITFFVGRYLGLLTFDLYFDLGFDLVDHLKMNFGENLPQYVFSTI